MVRHLLILSVITSLLSACAPVPLPPKSQSKPEPVGPLLKKAERVSLTNESVAPPPKEDSSDLMSGFGMPSSMPKMPALPKLPSVSDIARPKAAIISKLLSVAKTEGLAQIKGFSPAGNLSPTAENLSPTEGVQQGLRLLKAGNIDVATQYFNRVLSQDPRNPTAKTMLRQLQVSANQYYPGDTQFVFYKIKPGDSYSTIASKVLDDPLQFYILAKLNHHASSHDLKIGQIIKVPNLGPVTAKAKRPAKKERSTFTKSPKSNRQYLAAKKQYEDGRYRKAIKTIESSRDRGSFKSRELLRLSYNRYASALIDQKNLTEASVVLKKAIKIQPNNKTLKTQLAFVQKQTKSDRLYQKGVKSVKSGNTDRAYDQFSQVLRITPNHRMARKQIVKLKSVVIKRLHASAMILYKNQELGDAIGKWDEVLQLNPNHKLAKLYRGRALELKERLDSLPQ